METPVNMNPMQISQSLKSTFPLLVASLWALVLTLSSGGFAQTETGMPAARPTQKIPVHADPKVIPRQTDTSTMSDSQRAALLKSGALTMTDAQNGVLHFYHPNHGPKSPKQAQM